MTALLKYDAACRALAEASTIDEVKDIMDKAEALRLYAKQAKNTELEERSALIRVTAKRRFGEMIAENKRVGKIKEGRPRKNGNKTEPLERIKIEDLGVDKRFSSEAQELAAMTEDSFQEVIGRISKTIRENSLRGTRIALNTQEKKESRAQKEKLLGEYQSALPAKKYGVVVADPEWRFEPYSRNSGMDRAADNHYPTTETVKIKVRDVGSIAADDCVLFLWTTNPMLRAAFEVMKAWGFSYKSNYVWGKDKAGTGYWNREKHELLLIGTKGNPPAPAPGTQHESLILAPRGKHSAKPEIFLEMIEQYYPTLPKIELNRRGPARKGWDAWGNEAERIADESLTNHEHQNGTDAAIPTSAPEPASAQSLAPQPTVDAGSPLRTSSSASTFVEIASFVDLTSAQAGSAS
jgi:N6-adenosine-specific RNA methylase IME4